VSLFGGLFGSKGGFGRDFKNQRDTYLGDLSGLLDYYRNPATYQQGMARFGEGYDANLANQRAAAGNNLGGRGFSGAGAPGLFQRQRAHDFGVFGQNLGQHLQGGYENALHGYGNALQGFQQSFYKAPSQGLFGGLAGLAGSYFGGLGGGGGGGGMTYGSGSLPYQTDPYQGMGGY
jgi:hypothetical protein